jgi:hopanoid biosynthesis associated radical SAM protein HpnH
MRFPISLTASLAAYIFKKKLTNGQVRFPLVLMLEPLHACNLTCTGCGRIREYQQTISQSLTVEQCLRAVDECGAPVVSICGGEPLIYPPISELARRVLERKKHIYLCTNGMFLEKRLGEFTPSHRFFFNVHLDGLEKTHDMCVERQGVFQAAVAGIRAAKRAGFMVCTNTTVYKETDMAEIRDLFQYLHGLGVDGFMLSPGYSYQAVGSKEIFMSRQDIHEKFRQAEPLLKRFKLNASPVYLEFLRGERPLSCAAWANPTYNTWGWRAPCYMITDGHHQAFADFLQQTPWEKYGYGQDPRCERCMMHCGYEPAAALGLNRKLGDSLKMALWALT